TSVKHGIQLAVRDINDSGMLGDTKLTMVFEDDEADGGDKTLEAYSKLKEEGLDIMVGSVTSDSALLVADKTKEDGIFTLTPTASNAQVIKNDNCFQVCFSDPNQGKASADYISENKLASKIAIIHDRSSAYSLGIYNTFKSEAAERGLEIVSDTTFTKDCNTDFSAQIKDAQEAGAELMFLPIYYQEAGAILTQANAANFKPKFFGCDGLDGILSLENFNMVLANDVLLLTPFAADSDAENIRKFDIDFREYFGIEPNQFAADAYDAVMVVAELIKREGITASMPTSDMCDVLRSAIANGFSYDGLTGSDMTWSADGAVSKEPKAVIIKDGAYVDFEKVIAAENAETETAAADSKKAA
ncbi:MAG: ABC transporter substrate-binding protein, partial [Ruminococcus sp.]|nr:ABC transporter substrate-binding protein [Ruminococcus sp.]